MKKYVFMTLIVGLVMLFGCSKNSQDTKNNNSLDTGNNYWVKQFKTAESFIGRNQSTIVDSLKLDGYKSEEGYWIKRDASQNEYVYEIEAYSDGKIAKVKFYTMGSKKTLGDDITGNNVFKTFLNYLGSSYSSNLGNYSFSGGISDSSHFEEGDFSKVINEIGSSDSFTLSWVDNNSGIIYVNRADNYAFGDYEFFMQLDISYYKN